MFYWVLNTPLYIVTTLTLHGLKVYQNKNLLQKQPPKGVFKERCPENMPQIHRRTSMPKCDFNKGALQFGPATLSKKRLWHRRWTPCGCFWQKWLLSRLLSYNATSLVFLSKIHYHDSDAWSMIESMSQKFNEICRCNYLGGT